MEMKTLVKLAVVVAIAVLVWKKGIPWWKEHHPSGTASSSGSPAESCVAAAEAASENWGSGLARFVNPPYDLAAWDGFRSGVEQRIRAANDKCSCAADSCTTARTAMSDLRGLVNEMDASIRAGSQPPSDAVQRQEAIDNAINSARSLATQGK
jgi:hypothetical protein